MRSASRSGLVVPTLADGATGTSRRDRGGRGRVEHRRWRGLEARERGCGRECEGRGREPRCELAAR